MKDRNFSWGTVHLLIRRYLAENSRQIWMSIGVCFGLMFLMALLFDGRTKDMGIGGIIWLFLFAIGGIAVQVSASLTFSSMSTKPKRIVAMMVPASKAEKFTSLILIYNIFGPIAIICSALLADTLSSMIHFHAPYFFGVFKLIVDIFPNIDFSDFREHWGIIVEVGSLFVLGGVGMLLFNQALYTLGSAFWPKKSFLKTFCVLYVIQMVFTIFFGFIIQPEMFKWFFELFENGQSWHFYAWGILITGYLIVFAIYWYAWRRYKNTQLVQTFMMN
ncbi:MAG: hypothetical protein HDS64_09020 [Bacteroidales bacterium]|nr:hypothetical protein [Bacteroidales bacterium]MBD5360195.1 hypothetical protein [Bacteroides sp.]MBD5361651.1 hypothetical protein [Bacteroides sp.]